MLLIASAALTLTACGEGEKKTEDKEQTEGSEENGPQATGEATGEANQNGEGAATQEAAPAPTATSEE